MNVSRFNSLNDILGSLHESHFKSVVPYLAGTLLRTSPPYVVAHGLLLIGVSAFITYSPCILVVMNFCYWCMTFMSILMRISYNVSLAVLYFVLTSVRLLAKTSCTWRPRRSPWTPSALLATIESGAFVVPAAVSLEGNTCASTRAS